ncbi:hypothetical protein AB0F42_25680 [Streptomyces buecherae]|uniref:hypothetical protein n=1 Tax=Streptomyces buecherae TaxID=2763006 RepID=UPI00341014D3
MGTKHMRTRAAELVSLEGQSRRASARTWAESATWCSLVTALPGPPPAGAGRVRPRRRPLPRALATLGFVVASPPLLVAAVEGWDGPALSARARRARKDAREAVEHRAAAARQQGLYQTFDGDWDGAAGRTLLSWYAQAPDGERLIVPTAEELVLLAAPSRVWFTGRARRLRIVTRIPYRAARPDIPRDADQHFPRFRLSFPDGTWLTLLADDDNDQVARFFRTCRSIARRTPAG